MKVFISHIHEEKDLAALLKARIAEDFLGKVECFVSSDTESVLAGEIWLRSVEKALNEASIEVILCSAASVKRPWINFEAGAGWIRGIRIVPVCHSGLAPGALPLPLNLLEAISASEPPDLQRLYKTIADAHKSNIPRAPLDDLARQVRKFEVEYGKRKPRGLADEAERDRLAIERMLDGLKHPQHRFRTIERLSIEAGIPEGEAVDLLRRIPDVVFSKNEDTGKWLARLKSR